jgi:hypothetical protein
VTTQGIAVEPIGEEPPLGSLYLLYLPITLQALQGCLSSPRAEELAALLTNDPGQQRTSLTCNPVLAQVAMQRAEDMANRNYYAHVNPDGYGPNYLVRAAGYVLPANYSQQQTGNNVESIGAGYQDCWGQNRFSGNRSSTG